MGESWSRQFVVQTLQSTDHQLNFDDRALANPMVEAVMTWQILPYLIVLERGRRTIFICCLLHSDELSSAVSRSSTG